MDIRIDIVYIRISTKIAAQQVRSVTTVDVIVTFRNMKLRFNLKLPMMSLTLSGHGP